MLDEEATDSAIRESREALARRVRALRKQNGQTLTELGMLVGLSASALSKVENGSGSISFDALARLAVGLKVTVAQLFDSTESGAVTGRLSVTREGGGRVYETNSYLYRLLCTDLAQKRMVPIHATIKADSPEAFGPLTRHGGEEFIYILSGRVEVLTEFYEPICLAAGEAVYLDSAMGHGVIRAGSGEADILFVSYGAEFAVRTDGETTGIGSKPIFE